MYELKFKDKITAHLPAETSTSQADPEDANTAKARRMKTRRAVRRQCWRNESEGVRKEVMDAIEEEKAQVKSLEESMEKGLDSKTPAELQE